MKKEYKEPQVCIVTLKIHGMLASSPPGYGGEAGARPYYMDEEQE